MSTEAAIILLFANVFTVGPLVFWLIVQVRRLRWRINWLDQAMMGTAAHMQTEIEKLRHERR